MALTDIIGQYVLLRYEQTTEADATAEILGVFKDLWTASQTAIKSDWNASGRGVFEIHVYNPFDQYPHYKMLTRASRTEVQ